MQENQLMGDDFSVSAGGLIHNICTFPPSDLWFLTYKLGINIQTKKRIKSSPIKFVSYSTLCKHHILLELT